MHLRLASKGRHGSRLPYWRRLLLLLCAAPALPSVPISRRVANPPRKVLRDIRGAILGLAMVQIFAEGRRFAASNVCQTAQVISTETSCCESEAPPEAVSRLRVAEASEDCFQSKPRRGLKGSPPEEALQHRDSGPVQCKACSHDALRVPAVESAPELLLPIDAASKQVRVAGEELQPESL
jgi:hypothetical protein